MKLGPKAFTGAEIFDGFKRHYDAALLVDSGNVVDIVSAHELPEKYHQIKIDGGVLTAGFVDLQVNGGGGVMLNNAPSVDTIRTICDAHVQFGTTSLLPTLITDSEAQVDAAIIATHSAISQGVSGAIGLHLEGPHLSIARKGAHDPNRIRKMSDVDCGQLAELAGKLPSLLLTVATESVSLVQIEKLSHAGAVISIGHSNADYATVRAAERAGATCVTHLFNAMSQLGNRAPGVVGAALESPGLFAGLIADGIHVDTNMVRIAMRAKNAPGRIFLVTDAMATVGSDIQEFTLNGRKIMRSQGRLVLSDGTLAGADLDMISAVQFMVREIGTETDEALRMASLYPAQLLGRENEIGRLGIGARADFVHLNSALEIKDVWRGGASVIQNTER